MLVVSIVLLILAALVADLSATDRVSLRDPGVLDRRPLMYPVPSVAPRREAKQANGRRLNRSAVCRSTTSLPGAAGIEVSCSTRYGSTTLDVSRNSNVFVSASVFMTKVPVRAFTSTACVSMMCAEMIPDGLQWSMKSWIPTSSTMCGQVRRNEQIPPPIGVPSPRSFALSPVRPVSRVPPARCPQSMNSTLKLMITLERLVPFSCKGRGFCPELRRPGGRLRWWPRLKTPTRLA